MKNKKSEQMFGFLFGAEGGIRTLATVTRPTSLAGKPLRPLEYFCIDVGYSNIPKAKCQIFFFHNSCKILACKALHIK